MALGSPSVTFKLLLDESNFDNELQKAVASTKKLATGLSSLTAGVSILSNLGGAATSMAMDFEQGFAKVSTLFGDVEVDTDNLKTKIMELSTETGIASTELEEGLYQALSAGIPVTKDMGEALDFLNQATKLSVAGFTSIDKAVDVTTSVLNAYGLEVGETERVMNTLIETQNAGKTTVDELASSLGKVIPAASALGVNFEELSAAMAVLTANGINTAESTTKLKALFNEMIDPVSDINDLFSDMAGVNIPKFIASGGSLQEVLNIVNDALIDQGQSWYELMGTVEGADAAQTLMKDGGVKLAETYERMTDDTYELNDAYEKMQTPAQNLAKIHEGFNNALIDVGETILKILNPALEILADNIDWLAPIIITVTGLLGVLLTVTGAVALAGFAASAAMSALGVAIAILTSPVTLIVAGIMALVIGFEEIYTHSEALIDIFSQLDGALGTFGTNIVTFVTEVGDNLKTFFELVGSNFSTFFALVKQSWSDFWTTLRENPQAALQGLLQDIGTFGELLLQNIASFGELLLQNLKTFVKQLETNFANMFGGGAITENLLTFFEELNSNFSTFAELFSQNTKTFLTELGSNFSTFGGLANKSINDFWTKFQESPMEAFKGLLTDLDTFAELLWSNLKTLGSQLLSNTVTFFEKLGQNIYTGFNQAMQNIGTVIDNIGPTLKAKWQEFWDELPEIALKAWHKLNEYTSKALNKLTELFRDGSQKMNDIWTYLWSHQEEIADVASDVIVAIVEFLWDVLVAIVKAGVAAIIATVVYLWEHKEELFQLGVAAIQFIWEQFWNFLFFVVTTLVGIIIEAIVKFFQDMWSAFTEWLNEIKAKWDNFWDSLYDKTVGRLQDILDAILNKGREIRSGIENLLPGNIGTDYSTEGAPMPPGVPQSMPLYQNRGAVQRSGGVSVPTNIGTVDTSSYGSFRPSLKSFNMPRGITIQNLEISLPDVNNPTEFINKFGDAIDQYLGENLTIGGINL